MEKRSFAYIRKVILNSLLSDNTTINSISKSSNINWKTCENHLTYLCGRGLVSEVFSSDYVRMFQLTKKGKFYLEQSKDNKDYDYKDVSKIMREMMEEPYEEEQNKAG